MWRAMFGDYGNEIALAGVVITVTSYGVSGDYGEALVALSRIRARRAGHPSADSGREAHVSALRSPKSHAGTNVVSLSAYRTRRRTELAQRASAEAASRNAR